MAKRDAVFPAGRQALYEKNRYSAAIRSGDLLFVSGQVGSREDGSPEPIAAEELSEQAEQEEMLREPAPPAEHETAQDALRLLVRLSGGQRA